MITYHRGRVRNRLYVAVLIRYYLLQPRFNFAMTWPGILGWTVSLLAFIKAQLVILLLHVLSAGPIPRHVAFEMDGNRRFARLTGRRAVDGHSDGFHTLKQVHPLILLQSWRPPNIGYRY